MPEEERTPTAIIYTDMVGDSAPPQKLEHPDLVGTCNLWLIKHYAP